MKQPLILVVDDDPVMREVTRIHLEQAGYGVELASGGEEGVIKSAALQPSAVIMDFAMPGVSGRDALERIRANPETALLPVVMLSAWSADHNRRAVRALGANWLEKPLNGDALIDIVKQLLA
ncbi:response regulator [uncultured Brevundimonas sp.]|mgnify:CR=1 FL=1|uniref:response regulator n=1 Tax=uncultured Brevundimonas sp. TaxID=213418 RepID=UPI0030EF5115|tara:strand:- start:19493 stop:19858 length:366 start_codon:yes stop_codon:yes gene_type:complete